MSSANFEAGDFHIQVQAHISLDRSFDEGVQEWALTLMVVDAEDDGEAKEVAGKLRAFRFLPDELDPIVAADALSHDLLTCVAAIWDRERSHFKKELGDEWLAESDDILIIDHVELSPRYRGGELGLTLISRAIDLLGRGCAAVALIAGYGTDRSKSPEQQREAEIGRAKLARHYGRLGFQMADDVEHVMYLNLLYERPRLEVDA